MRRLGDILSWTFLICLSLAIRYWKREDKCLLCGRARHDSTDRG